MISCVYTVDYKDTDDDNKIIEKVSKKETVNNKIKIFKCNSFLSWHIPFLCKEMRKIKLFIIMFY